jgi:hypothetical protein
MFHYVFQQQTPQLAAQQRQWREEFDLTLEMADV